MKTHGVENTFFPLQQIPLRSSKLLYSNACLNLVYRSVHLLWCDPWLVTIWVLSSACKIHCSSFSEASLTSHSASPVTQQHKMHDIM